MSSTYTRSQIIKIIDGVAQAKGVTPTTAVADAYVESGLNPKAVGDHGTSFGLYQLHEGGELGNLTPSQAFNPRTNANVALSTMGQVQAQHPNWSPGAVAAAAQRPANPGAYAQQVNAEVTKLHGSTSGLSGIQPASGFTWYNPSTWVSGTVHDFENMLGIGIGVAIVLVGLIITFKSAQTIVEDGAKAGAVAAVA
ncbi:MAG: transglycosylase SLT domain-containing protein [Acidobacteriaceae bacterium]